MNSYTPQPRTTNEDEYDINDLSSAVTCLATFSRGTRSPSMTGEPDCNGVRTVSKVGSKEHQRNGDNVEGEEIGICKTPLTFPQILMDILSIEEFSDIISWLDHGCGFMIHEKKRFTMEVLPRYFRQVKYTSFTRKLNRWSFIRISRGPEAGAYYHKYFRRDDPRLCLKMSCQSVVSSCTNEQLSSRRLKPTQDQSRPASVPSATPGVLADASAPLTKLRLAQECNDIMNDIVKLQYLTRKVTLKQQLLVSDLRNKRDRHLKQHEALLTASANRIDPTAAIQVASMINMKQSDGNMKLGMSLPRTGVAAGCQQMLRILEDSKTCARKQRRGSLGKAFAA